MRAEKAEGLAELLYREASEAGFNDEDVEEALSELTDGVDLATYIEAKLASATTQPDDADADDEE